MSREVPELWFSPILDFSKDDKDSVYEDFKKLSYFELQKKYDERRNKRLDSFIEKVMEKDISDDRDRVVEIKDEILSSLNGYK